MAPRRRIDPPVDIVLTEEDLAAIIRETVGGPPAAVAAPAPPGAGFSLPAPQPTGADRAWSLGVRSPGAVGDAIRRILEATTLDRGRRPRVPGAGE